MNLTLAPQAQLAARVEDLRHQIAILRQFQRLGYTHVLVDKGRVVERAVSMGRNRCSARASS